MKSNAKTMAVGGMAGWLLEKLRVARRSQPRLALLERIALAPRQSLALVEADGRQFLVATSPEGKPAFFELDGVSRSANPPSPGLLVRRTRPAADRSARISW